MARLFISEKRLETWNATERVRIEGDRMTLAEDGRSFVIRPAVRFVSVTGGDSDPHALLGKVKDEESLVEMGADHYMDSVIFGDTAYEVQSGFIGDPLPKGRGSGA